MCSNNEYGFCLLTGPWMLHREILDLYKGRTLESHAVWSRIWWSTLSALRKDFFFHISYNYFSMMKKEQEKDLICIHGGEMKTGNFPAAIFFSWLHSCWNFVLTVKWFNSPQRKSIYFGGEAEILPLYVLLFWGILFFPHLVGRWSTTQMQLA